MLQGIGPIIATAIATTVADPGAFRSGREFVAWLGLVPRQNSTGGKTRLGRITKRGNRYLCRLLINGASANLLRELSLARRGPSTHEKARLHHAARRRGGGMAARHASAAAGDTGGHAAYASGSTSNEDDPHRYCSIG